MINIKEDEKLSVINHSCAHLLAQAVKRIYPEAKFWVGPVIEEGFYYDMDLNGGVITEEDFAKIEREMKKISKDGKRIIRKELTRVEALELFMNDEYKVELINSMTDAEVITAYSQGEFTDLCRGPHVDTVKELKHFKLLKCSGAYFKADKNNKMLQRVYGICFDTEERLNDYLAFLEDAKERDHRKIGKELDLFCNSEYVGPGLPLYTPRGVIIKDELQKEVERICKKNGFEKVSCPSLANISLFETSGHAAKFNDELFRVQSPKGHEFVLKPVQCPHHTQLFASKIRSYKDLPIRYMESDKQYRAELQGAVSGMSRVYAITVEDGHVFCTREQVKEEIKALCSIIKDFYTSVGLWENNWVSLSVRDSSDFSKYIGTEEDWDICESILQEVSDELGLNAKRCEGEAALYGPKLDFMFKDAMGRELQIPTVQIDFATPKRFDLSFINEKGEKETPVMVHRAILGSYERFFVLMIEHFKGAFPLWLSPVQANIVPINSKHHSEYAKEIEGILLDNDIRTSLDESEETLNYRIRQSNIMKNPITIILGDSEKENKTISFRLLGSQETKTLEIEEFIKYIKERIKNKK